MKKLIDVVAGITVALVAAKAAFSKGVATTGTDSTAPSGGAIEPAAPAHGIGDAEPRTGWKDLADRVRRGAKEDNLPTVAAAMTYYGLLALFPALIAVVSLYGIVSDPAEIQDQIASVSEILPEGAADIVTEQMDEIVSSSSGALGVGFAISLLATLWTVSSGVSALIKAINTIHDETESRGFVKLRLIALALTLGLIGFAVGSVLTITALPALLDRLDAPSGLIDGVVWLRWPGLGLLLIIALAVFYRVAPNRDPQSWRWVSWGAVMAAVTWLIASLALSFYVSNFASYNETYGALGGVIVLLLWMFVSSLIVLLGAEFDAQMELARNGPVLRHHDNGRSPTRDRLRTVGA